MRAPLAFVVVLALPACADFPALDATVSSEMKAAAYPSLAPTSALAAQQATPQATSTTAAALTGRAAALRARATRLSGSVVSSTDKARLQTGVRTPSG